MRFSLLFSATLLAGLAGCTAKPTVEPVVLCGTSATVRLCPGHTLMCPTEHTTLELADGTRLRPSGPLWDAYQPHQVDRQVLHIGYKPGQALPAGEVGNVQATITCLEPVVMDCGIPAAGGR